MIRFMASGSKGRGRTIAKVLVEWMVWVGVCSTGELLACFVVLYNGAPHGS